MTRKKKILVVDDSPTVRAGATWALERAGYDVVVLDTPFAFSQVLNSEKPDLVLMDVSMPGLRGDKVVEIAHRYDAHRCPIVLFSSQPIEELQELVRTLKIAGCIPKDLELLVSEVPRYLP